MGIKKENISRVAHIINGFLGDEFLLYLKTKNAHWEADLLFSDRTPRHGRKPRGRAMAPG